MSEFPMKRICDECPWRRDVPVARNGAWKPGEQEAVGGLYDNFDQMAKANGYGSKS